MIDDKVLDEMLELLNRFGTDREAPDDLNALLVQYGSELVYSLEHYRKLSRRRAKRKEKP